MRINQEFIKAVNLNRVSDTFAMKSLFILILVSFFLISCSSSRKIIIPPPQAISHEWKTPTLIIPQNADEDMLMAAKIFGEYANSDEFYSFLRRNVSSLDGGNESNVDSAISKYRQCLNAHDPIEIVLKKYSVKNRAIVIGGWRKTYLAQNDFKKLDPVERASHWIHEISHACGFTHVENDIKAYPVIKQSWPYVVGRMFKEFLLEKAVSLDG